MGMYGGSAYISEPCGALWIVSAKSATAKLRTRTWKDQAGNDRFTTEIIASDMLMLDSASSGSAPRQAPANQQSSEPPAPSDFDNDIPF